VAVDDMLGIEMDGVRVGIWEIVGSGFGLSCGSDDGRYLSVIIFEFCVSSAIWLGDGAGVFSPGWISFNREI
jgi:hypothetical protein